MAPAIDERLAQRAVTFISNLKHCKDRWAGQLFAPLPWQEKLIRQLFGTLGPDGLRQYHKAFVEIPKKCGKTFLCAAIALYLLAGDGTVGAEIYSAAADKEQAGIIYGFASQMVRQSAPLSKFCRLIDSQKRIVVPKTASVYRALSADVPTKHGYSPSGVIFDELHAQPNRNLFDVLTQGSGAARSQPLFIYITTAGFDRTSICWEEYRYAKDVLNGVINDPRYLALIYEVAENEDWEDEANWAKANPSLGTIFDVENLREEYREAKHKPALQNVFRRLRLNQWTQQDTRAIDLGLWDKSKGELKVDELEGEACYGGLDLSATTDLTALVLIFPPNAIRPGYKVLPFFWIPKDRVMEYVKRGGVEMDLWVQQGLVRATEGNVVDYRAIRQTLTGVDPLGAPRIRALMDRYRIREIAYDPWNATGLVTDLMGDGVKMIELRQGYPSLSAPTKEFLRLVTAGELHHGGNPVLRWMVNGLALLSDSTGNLKPDKQKSTVHIDGVSATVNALARTMLRRDDESVYERRGPIEVEWGAGM